MTLVDARYLRPEGWMRPLKSRASKKNSKKLSLSPKIQTGSWRRSGSMFAFCRSLMVFAFCMSLMWSSTYWFNWVLMCFLLSIPGDIQCLSDCGHKSRERHYYLPDLSFTTLLIYLHIGLVALWAITPLSPDQWTTCCCCYTHSSNSAFSWDHPPY